jgi:segregation and condensation protein B
MAARHQGPALPDRERVRWFVRSGRNRKAPGNSFQILSDGGLVRSTRLARLEAALLISDGAIPAKKLAQIARLIDAKEVQQLAQILNESYDRTRSAFRIEQTAAGYVMMTRAALSPWLDRLHNRQAEMKLSAPMMETLTIVAYQQPVTRADVEAIRGVQSSEMIRQLMDRGLLRIGGEDDSLGRPFLYETTRQFLSVFGLRRLEDLPNHATLRRQRTLPAIAETGDEEDEESLEAA